ncbi:glycosyltransferase family 2 protein [uncultured Eubacterium sp.]|uniref:glycosyltransferase family 2 protein n=1 Tax=uncultured Eubacterium sp. TaxID=165185 RepID=UPI002672BBCC|nr:glycosyltransferase family 2 protein [uncultured Eubacterium sp.]
MGMISLVVMDRIVDFMCSINSPILFICSLVGIFMSILVIQDKPYMLIGLFTTRRFQPAKNNHKYAILIPARNEEPVIANLINSIKKQDYPQELITIFVVADNCTDNTAKVARDNGVICYEHFNPDERTKGFALKYLFEQIEKDYGIQSFEGYFIFDSDNLLKRDYISRMNDSFDAGEKIITSYRSTKNWTESWIASTYALHWLRSIRYRHRARSILHLATNIQGTGFLFSNEIVKNGWKYTSLTEDRALTADCVVDGYEISYNDDAIFYDEQPVSLKVALRQRLRWSKGHLQAFAESGWGLFKNIFVDKNTKHYDDDKWYSYLWRTIRHRFMSFDTFAQLLPKNIVYAAKWILTKLILYPFIVWKMGATMYVFSNDTYISTLVRHFTGNTAIVLDTGVKAYFFSILLALWIRLFFRIGKYFVNIWVAVYLFIIENRRIPKFSIWRKILYVFTWPTFDIIQRYTQYVALFKKVEWKPIPHNSKITIEDLEE